MEGLAQGGKARGSRGPGPVQQRRSAATRARVIDAAIECLAEGGLKNATATRISERAGVSWGGIQHQFGDKASIIDAVIQRLLEDFSGQFVRIGARSENLAGRVGALVSGAWDFIRNPAYKAFREILRSHAATSRSTIRSEEIMAYVTQTVTQVCQILFKDIGLPLERIYVINVVLFATLSGMAEQQSFSSYPEALTQRQLSVLEATILNLLMEPETANQVD